MSSINYNWFENNQNLTCLHMPHKTLDQITEDDIRQAKDQCFNAIQTPPLQKCVNLSTEAKDFHYNYLITDFEPGNIYGSQDMIREISELCHKYDIALITDLVTGHMAGDANDHYKPNKEVNPKFNENPYWWRPQIQIQDWHNRWQVIHWCNDLPGFNMDNYDLQDLIIIMMNIYIELGIDGFRFDEAKHFGLPSEGCDYWVRVLDSLIKKRNQIIAYGEILFENEELYNKYAQYIKVLTPDYMSDKRNAVHFVDSPDLYYSSSFQTSTIDVPDEEIIRRYAEACEEYQNMLFYARPIDYNTKTKEIIKLKDRRPEAWKNEDVRRANIEKIKRFGR